MKLGPISVGEPPPPQQQPNIFPSASIGSQQADPSKYAYHSESQKFRKEILGLKARLLGCELIEDDQGGLLIVAPIDEAGKPMKTRPFCTPPLQRAILSFAEERLTPGTTLSNYPIERVYELLMHDHKNLFSLIYFNMYECEVNYTEWKSLHFSILGMCESAYRRAVDNEERNWVTKFFNIISTINQTDRAKEAPSIAGLFKTTK